MDKKFSILMVILSYKVWIDSYRVCIKNNKAWIYSYPYVTQLYTRIWHSLTYYVSKLVNKFMNVIYIFVNELYCVFAGFLWNVFHLLSLVETFWIRCQSFAKFEYFPINMCTCTARKPTKISRKKMFLSKAKYVNQGKLIQIEKKKLNLQNFIQIEKKVIWNR